MLVRYCQLLAAFSTAGSQYAATILCCHTLAEAMLVHAAAVVRLKRSFHCFILFFIVNPTFGLQKYVIISNCASFPLLFHF